MDWMALAGTATGLAAAYGGWAYTGFSLTCWIAGKIKAHMDLNRGFFLDEIEIVEARATKKAGGVTEIAFEVLGSFGLKEFFPGDILAREVLKSALNNETEMTRRRKRKKGEVIQPCFPLPKGRESKVHRAVKAALSNRRIKPSLQGTHVVVLHYSELCQFKQIRIVLVPLALLDLHGDDNPDLDDYEFPPDGDHESLFLDLAAIRRKYEDDRTLERQQRQVMTVRN